MSLKEQLSKLSLTELFTLQEQIYNKIKQIEHHEVETIENQVLSLRLNRTLNEVQVVLYQENKETFSLLELEELIGK